MDASGVEAGDQASFFSWHSVIGVPINFQGESGIVTFWSIELRVPLEVSREVRTLSRWGRHLGLSLCSPQGIHTSLHLSILFYFILFYFICSEFCHTLKWNSHGFTRVPHPDPPSHLPLHPLPLGFPSAPGLSACLMHPAWAGDLFHPR